MKDLSWQDITDIAIELSENFEEIDPQWISVPALPQKICELDCFNDDPSRSNEKILEAIQMAWIDETQ